LRGVVAATALSSSARQATRKRCDVLASLITRQVLERRAVTPRRCAIVNDFIALTILFERLRPMSYPPITATRRAFRQRPQRQTATCHDDAATPPAGVRFQESMPLLRVFPRVFTVARVPCAHAAKSCHEAGSVVAMPRANMPSCPPRLLPAEAA